MLLKLGSRWGCPRRAGRRREAEQPSRSSKQAVCTTWGRRHLVAAHKAQEKTASLTPPPPSGAPCLHHGAYGLEVTELKRPPSPIPLPRSALGLRGTEPLGATCVPLVNPEPCCPIATSFVLGCCLQSSCKEWLYGKPSVLAAEWTLGLQVWQLDSHSTLTHKLQCLPPTPKNDLNHKQVAQRYCLDCTAPNQPVSPPPPNPTNEFPVRQ